MAGATAAGELKAPPGPAAGAAATSEVRARVEPLAVLAPDDDAALRALLRRSVVPGAVRLAFTREPSYALGEGIAGGRDHLVVARRGAAIVGIGRCSVRTLFRNGQPQRVAYLGELRLDEGARRGAALLRDGYRLLADAVAPEGIGACFTSIADDNARARTVLEHGAWLGVPRYAPIARLVTLVAPVARGARGAAAGIGGHRHQAVDAGIDAIAAFLARGAAQHHLALPWSATHVAALAAHGVTPADFVVLERGGAIAAVAAIWDQRPFRQVRIDGYGGALRWTRPLANLTLRLSGRPALPAPGAVLPQAALLGATVAAPDDWRALWPAVAHAAARRGVQWLTVARDARDPELPVLHSLLHARAYHTTLYDVALGGTDATGAWDDRLVRPEVGLL